MLKKNWVIQGGSSFVKVGDLVKYRSRVALVVKIDDEWVHAVELGERFITKYRKYVLTVVS